MKLVVEMLVKNGFMFKEIAQISADDKKNFKIKKKCDIFDGVDTNGNRHVVIDFLAKSRFIQGAVAGIEDISNKISANKQYNFKHKTLILHCVLCSKARNLLNIRGWNVHVIL